MFSLFTLATLMWGGYMYTNKQYVHKVHYLMLGLGVFKALTLFSQALMMHYIERTGKADGWNIAYYVFTFFRGVLFFTVVVLIGTGWSYMKPFLGDKEKRIIMIVVPLQVGGRGGRRSTQARGEGRNVAAGGVGRRTERPGWCPGRRMPWGHAGWAS